MKIISLIYIGTAWVSFSFGQTIYVPAIGPSNSASKTGYNLIFEEKFDGQTSLDLSKWNRSTPTDDGDGLCHRNLAVNPNNISVNTGVCKLEANGNNSSNGCEYSIAEIKSFSVDDQTFKDYFFQENSFIETRVKIPIKHGIGSAAWLYNCYPFYSEIDLWETNGDDNWKFTATYHWQDGSALACTSGQSAARKQDGSEITVKKLGTSQNLDLTSDWMTFAAKWSFDSLVWYLNNVKARSINLYANPPGNPNDYVNYAYAQPLYSLSLRLGIGPNSVGDTEDLLAPSDLPQSLQIDYVRIWKKAGYKAIFFPLNPTSICRTSGAVIQTSYYPGVTYSWDETYFDVEPTTNSANYPWEVWATPKTAAVDNTTNRLILTATFSTGYIEKDTLNIYVAPTAPPAPTAAVTSSRIGTSCFYQAKISLPNSYTTMLWNEDNQCSNLIAGTNNISGSTWYSKYGTFDGESSYTVKIKAQNACGISTCATKSFTTGTPPGNCQYRISDSTEVIMVASVDKNVPFSLIGLDASSFIFQSNYPSIKGAESLSLRIFNLFGNQIAHANIGSEQQSIISLANQPSGLYVACLFSQDGKLIDQIKFVKL